MTHRKGIYEKYIKRPQDFLLASAATVVLSPVMLATGFLVRKKLGIPIIFSQERPGLDGKIFKLYKFRSMTDERDEEGKLLPDDVRLTSFGKKLRSTSLDELPELFNIIRGDMSVVGPRPLLVQYLERYNTYQARRHEVRPGFTGLAQVHGRNAISWEEKFNWDVKYVDHVSFLGDWKIIFDTIRTVLKREGISAEGTVTMEEFMGSTESEYKKRILILANDANGLLLFRKELIEELLKSNEVYLSLPYGKQVDELTSRGCNFIDTSIERRGMNPKTDLKLFKDYLRILCDVQPDLVITYTIKPNIYGGMACSIKNIPYAVNITGLGTAFQGDGALRTMVTAMYKVALKKAKVVFFENTANRDLFIREKIVKIRQACHLNGAGVNLERFLYQDYPDNDVFHFLFIGRVMKEKGIEELFEAMRRLITEGEKCFLEVVGPFEENYKDRLEQFEKEGWLKYHGFQDDVRPFIRACDCFVLPSYHEGMANTNLECAASGRPLITSNIPGCREAVIDGETGYLCEAQKSDSLYEAMKSMMNNNKEIRAEMGKAGRRFMEKNFDKKNVVRSTLNHLPI